MSKSVLFFSFVVQIFIWIGISEVSDHSSSLGSAGWYFYIAYLLSGAIKHSAIQKLIQEYVKLYPPTKETERVYDGF